MDTDEGEVTPKKKRLVIVNDVRIYLNSIKQIVSTIKDVGIPVSMEQDVDGGDVLVTLRIRNTKNQKSRVCFKPTEAVVFKDHCFSLCIFKNSSVQIQLM